MNIKAYIYIILFTAFHIAFNLQANASWVNESNLFYQPKGNNDLKYPFEDKDDYPYELPSNDTSLKLSEPSNIESEVEYDPVNNEYVITDKMGDMDYRPPRTMTIDEYKDIQFQNSLRTFWNDKARGTDDRGNRSFMPHINIGGQAFNKIFGSNTVNIVPQGSAELIFSINTSRIDNPALQERLRRTTTFDFQENIQMSVEGSIGDKVKVTVTYDTEATFDFENKTNIAYTGEEDEIIQKIEAGNVSLPLTGSLITGSQNLFGLKTEMKFGHLYMTNVFSQQKGKTKTIEVEGGAEKRKFEVSIDDYDANKHFFIGHSFRENFDRSLASIPIINSGAQITKIEVWVTNKNSNFENSRNIVAFMDLGEDPTKNNVYNKNLWTQTSVTSPSITRNNMNTLYDAMVNSIGDLNNIASFLESYAGGILTSGTDYEIVENARLLSQNEYSINNRLGFISLNFALNSDEILAVAYEYTYQGKTYKVGQLSTDVSTPKNLMVKLVKGTSLTPRLKTWGLMMKNVYSLDAYQVDKEDFELYVYYENDETGVDVPYLPDGNIKNQLLLNVLNLDKANSQLDAQPDGMFDFIPGLTILPQNGRIIFPVLEPFGDHLAEKLTGKKVSAYVNYNSYYNSLSDDERELVNKYVYNELYDSTKTQAQLIASKNKFIISGSYKSSSGSEIPLNAMNVPKGSVKVIAGGRELVENQDYTVDYTLGRVKILNQGLLESGTPIQISLESNALYNLQTKTLIGSHMDYKISENLIFGGTILNLTERPLTKKVNVGDEPISNTIWGLNGTYTTESPLLTKLVDKIPLIDTKEKSTITFDAEFAHLIPGHSRAIEKSGVAYIDDFEGSETSIDLRSHATWVLASTPQGQDVLFREARYTDSLVYGFNRAKLAWYVIDPLFLRNNSLTPDNIKNNPDLQSSHYVREIYEKEIFPNKETPSGVPTNIPVLNLAYYPLIKGPYNFDLDGSEGFSAGVDPITGRLRSPTTRWGGIMREIPTTDFEEANIEFIDFWLMDPYVEMPNRTGDLNPALYFNIGEVSEDILKDSKKMFENGLTEFSDTSKITYTEWGRVPTTQSMVTAFDNNPEARIYQDVGFDGLNDEYERIYYSNYLQKLESYSVTAYKIESTDPSKDNFRYYRNSYYDNINAGILERYKEYNGTENNSPASEQTNEEYNQSSKITPDIEDINEDNTLNRTETYYQYQISLRPDDLVVGKNFITDKIQYNAKFENGIESAVNWLHFRVPIREYETKVGPIQDFKSIRFMRMFLKGFGDSIFLRFGTLDLIRGEWRKYNLPFVTAGEAVTIPETSTGSFDIQAVNIEENNSKDPVNYILPPGIDRVIDPASPQLRQLNEQAIALKVTELQDGNAVAAYKTLSMDMREYQKLQMFIHCEEIPDYAGLNDNEITAFIRLGTDYTDNYYEYEIPLKLTPAGRYNNDRDDHRYIVWPEANNMDIELDIFPELKLERNREMQRENSSTTYKTIYTKYIGDKKISIRGNPNLMEVYTIMIGIRNPANTDGNPAPESAEIWFNELRLTDFREKGGWAANARMTTQLADFANLSLAGFTSKPGFGSIEKKTSERSKEEIYQYDVSSNVSLDKFFPEKSGVRLPMFVGYSEAFVNPQYNPIDPDVDFKDALNNIEDKHVRDSVKKISQDYTRRKSLNFTNVGLSKTSAKGARFYDPANFSLSYAYNETFRRNINTEYDINKEYRGGINYNHTQRAKSIEPFRTQFKKPAYMLIRDFNFNYMPSMFGFRTNLERRYHERKIRNLSNPQFSIPPTADKDFLWLRDYMFKWDITRSLKFDFQALNTSRIDELPGVMNRDSTLDIVSNDSASYEFMRDQIKHGLNNFGRTIMYDHKINVTYNTPINKIRLLNWTSYNISYNSTYSWEHGPIFNTHARWFDEDTLWMGNNISNSNSIQHNVNFSMKNLYNKIPLLKKVSKLYRGGKRKDNKKPEKKSVEKQNIDLKKDKKKIIRHNLNNEKVEVWVTSPGGDEVNVEMKVINKNKIAITPKKNFGGTTVKVEGETTGKVNPLVLAGERAALLLMSVQSIGISYSEGKGMHIPGYEPFTRHFGMEKYGNRYAPGGWFILGRVEDSYIEEFNDNGWLSTNKYLTEPIIINNSDRLNLRGTLEPFNGLRINITGNRSYSKNVNNFFYPIDPVMHPIDSIINVIEGNFSISTLTIATAFEKPKPENNYYSKAFLNMLEYTKIIAQRLAEKYEEKYPGTYDRSYVNPNDSAPDPNYPNGYGMESPHVLIPAFIAAYTGKSANSIYLTPMPDWIRMLPNWQVRYNKLTDIPLVKKYFRTVNLDHAYSSTYTIGSFVNNLEYLNDPFAYNLDFNFMGEFQYSSVAISENFRPLFGVDMTFINNITGRFQLQRSRSIAISFSNNRLTEVRNKDIVIGAGYRFEKLPFNFRTQDGGEREMEGDLVLNTDFSIRDNQTILRDITGNNPDQPSTGKIVYTIKFSADYAISSRFNLRFFYDKMINKPLISRSFPTRNTNVGFSVRFTLTP